MNDRQTSKEKLEGWIWSFLRSVLEQGRNIQVDYSNGVYTSYEHCSARVDEAARERQTALLKKLETAHEPSAEQPRPCGLCSGLGCRMCDMTGKYIADDLTGPFACENCNRLAREAHTWSKALEETIKRQGASQPPALDPIEASARARYIELHGLPAHDPWELAPSATKEQYREWARNNTLTKGGEQS